MRLLGQFSGLGLSGYLLRRYYNTAKIYRNKKDLIVALVSFPITTSLFYYFGVWNVRRSNSYL
jgi:hypothetical protein